MTNEVEPPGRGPPLVRRTGHHAPGIQLMASVNNLWYVERKQANGSTKKVKTARHGRGDRWLLRWRDESGKPRKKSFARKADADRVKIEIQAQLVRGTYHDPDAGKVTFRAFAERWRKAQFADPNTAAAVETRFRLHVYPAIGNISLARITPSTIRDWLSNLTISRRYQEIIFKNVSQALTAAVADDDLITKNPCRSPTIRKPRADPRKVVPWTADWVAGVHDALPDRYRILLDLPHRHRRRRRRPPPGQADRR